MGNEYRGKVKPPGPGPFLAEITNHLDPTYLGGLEVALTKGLPGSVVSQDSVYIARYLTPFYGVTSPRFEGNDSSNFQDVQKSYGMWMIPPDVGTRVLVIFIEGDPNQCYWIGCVPDPFQNHMIPGIAASKNSAMTSEQLRKYGTTLVPVAEVHKGSQTLNDGPSIDKQVKPVHPFADRLLAQGLLLDTVRGVTSSSGRRETPSGVFGISTPGPLDTSDGSRRGKIGYTGNRQVPVTRLGGSTFVMDDGDVNGQNELVRIRTRTGHQILMHNSQDLIYIGNGAGTAWIEMTSQGKIDIYSADSVSIHTEADFNFLADRDVNIEAGRNVNIKSNNDFNINSSNDYNLVVDNNGNLLFTGNLDTTVSGTVSTDVSGSYNLTAKSSITQKAGGAFEVTSIENNLTSTGDTNISTGGKHYETATEIHMNGPTAAKAGVPFNVNLVPERLATFQLPNRNVSSGWSDGNFYESDPIVSIMQRAPTHEPWDQHENTNPALYSTVGTDVVAGATGAVTSAGKKFPLINPDQPIDWTNDGKFMNKVISVAESLGCNYLDLFACMAFETGRTFNPSLVNRIGATGLIQFIPSTAKSLGTNTVNLAGLTRTDQMDWVLKYFKSGPLAKVSSPSLADLYMAILWPAAVGKSMDYHLFEAGTKAYQQNPLDTANKGYVTKADAAAKVTAQLPYIKETLGRFARSGTGLIVTDGSGVPVRSGQ